jgi:hypothetical protein
MSIVTAPTPERTPASQLSAPPRREMEFLPALLSYLVPGLGQISQGRIGKGVLFFVCVYALFFYGTVLGSGTATVQGKQHRIASPVYLPDTVLDAPDGRDQRNNPWKLPRVMANLYNRPQFAAQFWVGIAAWPAVWQYWHFDANKEDPLFGLYQRAPDQETLNAVHNVQDKQIDLGWVFTVIAGVLNVLVIYDALAGPAHPAPAPEEPKGTPT